ncbi:MAG: FtsX-like permease family protein [Gammaproteobacteria bacterium]|nr:FtsX-like permease family protein [Gammaproteobacteria bacterium]
MNIGIRYARSRRSFISFVSALALGGLALSVAILVFVQAVVAGFEREMNERILGVVPHVRVGAREPIDDRAVILDTIRTVEGVSGAAAVVQGRGLVEKTGRVVGVNLIGFDPATYSEVSRIEEFVVGRDARLPVAGGFEILLGEQVAARLGAHPGDHVTVVLPTTTVTPLGVFARQKKLRVVGLVDTGSQLDRMSAYLNRADAAKLLRAGVLDREFHVKATNALDAETVRARITDLLAGQGFRGISWMASYGNLYAAIRYTKNMLFLLLSLLVAVAAFNLVSSLVMIVNERRGDIAILRTMGSPSGLVVGAFLVVGTLIAVVGIGLGVGAGMGLGVVAETGFPWLEDLLGTPLMGEYIITALPVQFAAADVARVAATAFALGIAATFFPAWRAARLNPADLLQHE